MGKFLKRFFLPAVLVFLITGLGVRLVRDREFRGLFDPQFWKQWWRVGQVMNFAHQEYLHPDSVTYEKLGNAALTHLLDGLDRYSEYMPPKEFDELQREGEQRFVGVGVELERRQGHIVITRVIPESPAARAHWQAGDRLLTVAETDVSDFTVPRTAEILRGLEDSSVRVVRERDGAPAPLEDTMVRHGFDVPSVRDIELRPDGVGYLKLTIFGQRSGDEVVAAIKELSAKGDLKGLVIDLRDNPGGLLVASIRLLKPFLPPGQLVVSTRGRDGNSEELALPAAKPGDTHYDGPLAVLVNDNSASASEILAGALQDTKRAVIVGERTVGKGVVQTVRDLPDGGGLRLTTEAYFLPNGRTIHEIGVTPDLPVAISNRDRDILRLQRSELRHLTAAEFANFYGFAPIQDLQLETAANLLLATERGK